MTGSLYLPHDVPDNTAIPDADVHYAEIFALVAKLCESFKKNTEYFTLWLSTCRNERLTINAIFQDVKEAFSPTKRSGPILDSIIYHIREKQYREARREIDKLKRSILPAISSKNAVWKQRSELMDHLNLYLGKVNLAERERLKKVLFEVKVGQTGADFPWSPAYLELETTDYHYLIPFWETLRQAEDFLRAYVKIIEVVLELQVLNEADTLPFENELQISWQSLLTAISESGESLFFQVFDTGNDKLSVSPPLPSGRFYLDKKLAAGSFVPIIIAPLLDAMYEMIVYEETLLVGTFKPVPTTSALPAPYVTDLRPKETGTFGALQVPISVRDFGLSRQTSLKIIVVGGYADSSFYRHREVDFDPISGGVKIFAGLSFEALEMAKAEGAQLLVLPEAFIPRKFENELCDKARELGISLIGGVEPGKTSAGGYENYAVFQDAHRRHPARQYKNFSSSEEPEMITSRGGQQLYKQSSVGNIAILVCSDLQQTPPITALTNCIYPVELLVVTSATKFPELQRAMAVADSARLHSYVVLANSKPINGSVGEKTIGQTCVVRPGKTQAEWTVRPTGTPLHLTSQSNETSTLGRIYFEATVYEINLSSLAFDRGKPFAGMIARPISRST